MFFKTKKKSTKQLAIDDPVYSGREISGCWLYTLKHGSNLDRFFSGIDIPRDRLLNDDEWFDIQTVVKIWENYRSCLRDFDMTETFHMAVDHMNTDAYGVTRAVAQLSSIKTMLRMLPFLAATITKIDLFKVLESSKNSAVIEYKIYPGFEDFIDSSHMFSFKGMFYSFPTIQNAAPASVSEVASVIDVFKKFKIDFSLFNHEITEKDEIVYLDNERAGHWIIIDSDMGLDPCIPKYLKGERCVLWEKDIIETKKNGEKIIIAQKGDLYNCSRSIFKIEWENPNFLKRMKNFTRFAKQIIPIFFKSRDALLKQTSMLHNQASTLQTRIREKTEELTTAHEEIVKLEKRSIEHRITGGFAHEMRNALAGAQLELKSLDNFTNNNKNVTEIIKDNLAHLLENINKIHKEYNIPKEKIIEYFIPDIKEAFELTENLSEVLSGISLDVNRGLSITNQIRNYAKMHEFLPGNNVVDFSSLLKTYKYKYQNDFKNNHIRFLVSSVDDANIKADKEHINSILTNLIFNAKDALIENQNNNGVISVTLESDNNKITIKISDNGPGISPSQFENIFEPFYTTKTSTGTGLGLGIVKRLVELYNGTITVSSVPNKQTTFEIIFPRIMNE